MGLASALSTALTGMAASETMVDVAGNNVANANTVGFKQSSAVFTTQFLQTMNLGTAPSGDNGGTNPEQVGLGTQVATITPDFSQGTVSLSSSPTDLAIQGNGFFIVQGSSGNTLYTRNGQFTLNSSNQLVNTTGQTLLGNGVNSDYQIDSSTLQPLTIPLGSTSVAQATQNVFLQGDLSPTDAVATTPQIIDSQTLSDASIPVPPNLTSNDITAIPPADVSGSTAAASTTAGSVAAGTYSYEITFVNSAGQESPPSAVIGPITTTGTSGVDESVQLSGLPSIPSGFSSINVYRSDASTGTFQLAGNTTGTTFTDSSSDAQLGAALNTNTLAEGNYSYYVTYYNSTTGLESRPTQVIGPQSLSVAGRDIELSNLPAPSGEFNSTSHLSQHRGQPNQFLSRHYGAGRNEHLYRQHTRRHDRQQCSNQLEWARYFAGDLTDQSGRAERFYLHPAVPKRHSSELHRIQGWNHVEDSDARRDQHHHRAKPDQFHRPGQRHSTQLGR